MTPKDPTGRASPRRALLALLGVVLLALGPALAPPAVSAAAPSLTLVTNARYDVLPAERRVAVTVGIVATNHLKDTAQNRYFFEQAYLAVQPGATDFKLSSKGLKPRISVAATEPTHTLLLIGFGTRLAAGKSLSLKMTFSLPDPGAPAARAIRVSNTIVAFSAWAFASDATPGSTVTLALPAGYDLTFLRGELRGPATSEPGLETWESGPLETPTTFEAAIRATRAPTYLESDRTARIGDETARITLRPWADDPAWLEQADRLTVGGAAALAEAIGRPWPLGGPLVVEEGLVGEASSTAGSFDPEEPQIEIAYYAGPEVVLHEVAHAWFNGSRLADRWANEAFASLYAELAAEALEEPILSPALTPALLASKVPLNAWAAGEPGDVAEAYGYAASLAVARVILERAGREGLTAVWTAIDEGRRPYGGAGATDPVDWRVLLDLLEEETSATYDDLWRRYVTRPADEVLLDARVGARASYATLVSELDDWPMPPSVGDAMRAWRFDLAQTTMTSARTVIARREQLRAASAAAGLTLPDSIRDSFAAGELGRAADQLEAAAAALDEIVAAGSRRPASVGPLEWLGLVGSDPEQSLGAARSAFLSGDLAGAFDAAAEAEAAWDSVLPVARGRIVGLVIGAIGLVLFLRLVTSRGWARQVGWS